jgi:hypothetical protein
MNNNILNAKNEIENLFKDIFFTSKITYLILQSKKVGQLQEKVYYLSKFQKKSESKNFISIKKELEKESLLLIMMEDHIQDIVLR